MQTIIQKAFRVMESEFKTRGQQFNNPEHTKEFCRLAIGSEPDDVFAVLFLDIQLGLIAFEKMFRGTNNETQTHARPILRKVFGRNAAEIILTHNHRSGDVTPSANDDNSTKTFARVFQFLDCPVEDNTIVSPIAAVSMRELYGKLI